MGRFEDIHTGLTKQYDLITLVGTLENLSSVMTGKLSAERFLQIVKQHLKPQGTIMIAVDNKYGLKYWAGCRDEKSGQFFGGLKSYKDEEDSGSYTLDSLKKLLETAGLGEMTCYYPYPEYRYVRCLYSDDFLPERGELTNSVDGYGESRMKLFDEIQVYDSLIEDGMFHLFSNAYLIVCSRKGSGL